METIKKRLHYALVCASLLIFIGRLSAQTCTSSQNGLASFASTWGGTPPNTCTDYVINHLVILFGDFNLTNVSITINGPDGVLLMTGSSDLSLTNSIITINNGASLFLLGELVLDNSPLIINPGGNLSGLGGTITAGSFMYPDDGTFQEIEAAGGLNVNGALPIELMAFTGSQIGNAIQLHWRTASEKNNDYIELQRSKDGKSFELIATVPGQGDSYQPKDYAHVDEQPLPGVNYYRLMQVDFDGKFEYHPIIAVLFKTNDDKASGIILFPTIVQEQLNFALPEEADTDGEFFVHDMSGRLILHRSFERGMQQQSIPVNKLPKGQYILTVQTGRELQVARFVKE